MFRMANFLSLNRPILVQLVLCLLVGCIAMHFIVEDSFLFANFASPVSSADNTEHMRYDEIEHQDDLVLLSSLPESVLDDTLPPLFAWAPLIKKQVAFLILPPPKI